ncbi:hypothetical protein ACJBXH_09150, partial [Streptococcus suis]
KWISSLKRLFTGDKRREESFHAYDVFTGSWSFSFIIENGIIIEREFLEEKTCLRRKIALA